MIHYQGLIGLILIVLLAWLLSEERWKIRLRPVVAGITLQFIFALLLLKIPGSRQIFLVLNQVVRVIEEATNAGTSLVFGYLGGAPSPFMATNEGTSFILAFKALPIVLVISAISSLLFYWRIMPFIVKTGSHLLEKTMGVGGALGVSAAANVFVGMVEAPLLIRPYLLKMSRGELFAVMTCGMSTLAGTVLVLYASILQKVVPDALGHILTASLISAPAAIAIALILVPHVGVQTTGEVLPPTVAESSMDAIVKGAAEGLKLLLNIVAMLIVFVALISIINAILSLFPLIDGQAITMQRCLGWLLAPIAWAIGIPWESAPLVGSLLGTKTILNEFVAYLEFASLDQNSLNERSRLISVYALCGFANFGSLGIMLGGLSAMVPERRREILGLGLKSILSGTMATCMTGAVVGIIF